MFNKPFVISGFVILVFFFCCCCFFPLLEPPQPSLRLWNRWKHPLPAAPRSRLQGSAVTLNTATLVSCRNSICGANQRHRHYWLINWHWFQRLVKILYFFLSYSPSVQVCGLYLQNARSRCSVLMKMDFRRRRRYNNRFCSVITPKQEVCMMWTDVETVIPFDFGGAAII